LRADGALDERIVRSRVCRLAICALTSRSIRSLASLDTLILKPASVTALSASVTSAVRLGSSRQLAVNAGLACTTTLPRTSARWSSTLLVSLPTSFLIDLSSRPVIELVILPACVAICPVTRKVPLSGVVIARSLGCPFITSAPRATMMPISAFDSRLLTGLSSLPASSRGAAASRLRLMALSATATGAIT
jgi:hypothetical protein